MSKKSYLTATDQFCGAGGSSQGAVRAGIEVRMAMNHWELAIQTHNTNFPETDHDCTDISATDPRRYPSTDLLISSPECVNHSLAKGKKRKLKQQMELFGRVEIDPAEERSRATAWDVVRFAEYHSYNLIVVENVVDFRAWVLYESWIMAMSNLGYEHHAVYYNSMFAHPTPQSRDRMYVVFWKRGNKPPDLEFRPKAWCHRCESVIEAVQTWKNTKMVRDRGGRWGRYGVQYVYCCSDCLWKVACKHGRKLSDKHLHLAEVVPFYYAAFNCIDWSITAPRIGDRSKPLAPKTMARITYGLEKYGREPLVITGRYTSGVDSRVRQAGSDVLPTQPGDSSHALLTPFVIQTTRVGSASGIDEALATVTAGGNNHALISTEQVQAFLSYYYGNMQASGIDDPISTVTGTDRAGLVQMGEEVEVEDCTFRMLAPHEIKAAMAFPAGYIVLGTNRDQVKQCGNAVTPPVMEMLIREAVRSLL